MYPILFFSLVIILGAALPWCPYSAYGRLPALSPMGLASGHTVVRRHRFSISNASHLAEYLHWKHRNNRR